MVWQETNQSHVGPPNFQTEPEPSLTHSLCRALSLGTNFSVLQLCWSSNHIAHPCVPQPCVWPNWLAMDIPTFLERLVALARPQAVLTSDDQRFVFKFCEVSKAFLREKAQGAVQSGEHRPMLYHYGSDGTPLLTQHRFQGQHQGSKVQRQGGVASEFLVERAFVNVYGPQWEVMVSFLGRDPRPLSSGKSTWHIFGALVQFFPMLERIRSAPGISIYHFCFDRALLSAMKTKLVQRHALFQAGVADGTVPIAQPGMTVYMPQMSWLVVQGCSLHDAHNALQWGLKAVLEDMQKTTKSLHIVIESLRNSYGLLQLRLPLFLSDSLALDDGADYDSQALYHQWVNLGCDSHIAELLGELHLRWEPARNRLLVAAKHSSDLALVEKISFVLLSVMKFKRFSDSRWLTIGESCRSLLCALLLGLHRLVEITRTDPAASDYHLHGFSECTEQVKLYCCVAGFVSRVPEALLSELLEDDALACKGPLMQQIVEDEVQCLTVIPREVWRRAATLLQDTSDSALRNLVLHSAYVALAMLQQQVFTPLSAYPWCLCHGDVDEKLDILADPKTATPSCEVTANVQFLLRQGYNRVLIKKALELLGQVPWSTNVQEQGHASASTIHRAHKQYGQNVLAARSQLHMIRPLFLALTSQKIEKLQGQALRLRRRLSKKLIGRHIFLAEFMAANQTLHPRWSTNPDFSRAVLAQHGRVWRLLGAEAQQDYEVRAQASDRLRQDTLQEKLLGIEELIQQSASEDEKRAFLQQASFKVSTAAWSMRDVEDLLLSFASESWSQSKVQDLRAQALLPPEPPTQELQAQLEQAQVPLEHKEPQPPGWMKVIARLRQAFGGAVLALITEEKPTFWLFLCARQSPFCLYFLELLLQDGVRHPGSAGSFAEVLKACAAEPQWSFQRSSTTVSLDYELPQVSAEHVFVLPQVAFHPHNTDSFASWATFLPLEACLEPHDASSRLDVADNKARAPAKPTLNQLQEQLQKYPWLQAYARTGGTESSGATSSSAVPPHRVSVAEAELGDAELEEVFQELERARSRWRTETTIEVHHFKCFVLGGQWTKQNTGVSVDTIKARACGKDQEQWCLLHGLPRSMSFAIRKFGEEAAGLLGQAYCAVMEWFYEHLPLPAGDLRDLSSIFAELDAVQHCRRHVQALGSRHAANKKLDDVLALRPTS